MPATSRPGAVSQVTGRLSAMGMILVGRRVTAADHQRLLADHSLTDTLLYADRTEPDLDVDKAWHGIHFLLAGNAWETTAGAGEAVLGGEPVGEDAGYGPARLLGPEQVRTVAAALTPITVDTLRSRYDGPALEDAEVYPQIWDEEDVFDTYLAPNFTRLRDFYRAAADAGQAVLLAIA